MSNKQITGDRYIPFRSTSRFHALDLPPPPTDLPTGYGSSYTSLLFDAMFGENQRNKNIFCYRIQEGGSGSGSNADQQFGGLGGCRRKIFHPHPKPYKVLDAPGLSNDFLLNLLDWSASNVLCVGIGTSVYLYYPDNERVVLLLDLLDDTVCSLGWNPLNTSHLAVGTNSGKLHIWDASESKRITTIHQGHRQLVGALAWGSSYLLASGSGDSTILVRDTRLGAHCYIGKRLRGHTPLTEVCGLKWSHHDHTMLASSGTDNCVNLWNLRSSSHQPVSKFHEHTCPVKAISWSPHDHALLASGGTDGCIRFWDTTKNSHLNCIHTVFPVSNLTWSKSVNQLVTTHSPEESSQHQIVVWTYPTMSKLATLCGNHTDNVLYLAQSPDGSNIVTGADDEALRFWNIFPPVGSNHTTPLSSFPRTYIR